jgi:hypothetical protein
MTTAADQREGLLKHLKSMFEIVIDGKDPDNNFLLKERVSDLKVNLLFNNSNVFGGYVQAVDQKTFDITVDEQFLNAMGAFISCLVSLQDGFLDRVHQPKKLEEVAETQISEERRQRRAFIKKVGANEFWKLLTADKLGPTKSVYETILNELLLDRPVLYVICKIALLAASAFLALHESCHAFGGHLDYRRKSIQALPNFEDSKELAEFRDCLETLEHVADLAGSPLLFGIAASHDFSFENIAKANQIEDLNSVYCAGYSVGLGVAFLFLLTDALFEDSPEDYHPPATERMLLILGNTIWKCPKLSQKEPAEITSDAISIPYDMGQFEGIKACVDTWDKLGLSRRKNKAVDDFLRGTSPCILCNDGADAILERFIAMSARAEHIKSRMDEWKISDRQHRILISDLSMFSSKLIELRKAREDHLALRKTLLDEENAAVRGK